MSCEIKLPTVREGIFFSQGDNFTTDLLRVATFQSPSSKSYVFMGADFSKPIQTLGDWFVNAGGILQIFVLVAFFVLVVYSLFKVLSLLKEPDDFVPELQAFLARVAIFSFIFVVPMPSEPLAVQAFRFMIRLGDQLAFSIFHTLAAKEVQAKEAGLNSFKNQLVSRKVEEYRESLDDLNYAIFVLKDGIEKTRDCYLANKGRDEILSFLEQLEARIERVEGEVNAGRAVQGNIITEAEKTELFIALEENGCPAHVIGEGLGLFIPAVKEYNQMIVHADERKVEGVVCDAIKKFEPYYQMATDPTKNSIGWSLVAFQPLVDFIVSTAVIKEVGKQEKQIKQEGAEGKGVSMFSASGTVEKAIEALVFLGLPPGSDLFNVFLGLIFKVSDIIREIVQDVVHWLSNIFFAFSWTGAGAILAVFLKFVGGDFLGRIFGGVVSTVAEGALLGVAVWIVYAIVSVILLIIPIIAAIVAFALRFSLYIVEVAKFTLIIPFFAIHVAQGNFAPVVKRFLFYSFYGPTLVIMVFFAFLVYSLVGFTLTLLGHVVIQSFDLPLIGMLVFSVIKFFITVLATIQIFHLVYDAPDMLFEIIEQTVGRSAQVLKVGLGRFGLPWF